MDLLEVDMSMNFMVLPVYGNVQKILCLSLKNLVVYIHQIKMVVFHIIRCILINQKGLYYKIFGVI